MRYRLSRKYYRALLRLYPNAFRDSYSSELEQAFLESLEILHNRNRWVGVPYAWYRVLRDTLAESSAQRRAPRAIKLAHDSNTIVRNRAMLQSISQ